MSQSKKKTDIICFHSYVEFETLKRRPWGKGMKNKLQTEREANHKRLLNTENKLRVDGGGEGEGKLGDRY